MNEAQITQMLVQAVQSKGEAINPLISDKLQMKRAPVDMTEKQRLTCQLIVQQFFAELGDKSAMTIQNQRGLLSYSEQEYNRQVLIGDKQGKSPDN